MHIAAAGVINSLGNTLDSVFAAYKAGINRYQNSGYQTASGEPINMAEIPVEALDPLSPATNLACGYDRWERHLLSMAVSAANQCVEKVKMLGITELPMVLAFPEQLSHCGYTMPKNFVDWLAKETDLPLDGALSRVIQTGRVAGIDALETASRYFELNYDYVLVGSADSYQRSNLFRTLVEEERLMLPGGMQGFVAGEGAAFLLLAREPTSSRFNGCRISKFDTAAELGHFYSEAPYLGEGLANAFNSVLSDNVSPLVSELFSTLNGEQYWAKELGVAMTRNHNALLPDAEIHHPAEFYGDIGCASVFTMLLLSALSLKAANRNANHLVVASSDLAPRGAALLNYTLNRSTHGTRTL